MSYSFSSGNRKRILPEHRSLQVRLKTSQQLREKLLCLCSWLPRRCSVGVQHRVCVADEVLYGDGVWRGVNRRSIETIERPRHDAVSDCILSEDEGVKLSRCNVDDAGCGDIGVHIDKPAHCFEAIEEERSGRFQIFKRSVHQSHHVAGPMAASAFKPITKVCTVKPFGLGLTGLWPIQFAGHVKTWPPVGSWKMIKV